MTKEDFAKAQEIHVQINQLHDLEDTLVNGAADNHRLCACYSVDERSLTAKVRNTSYLSNDMRDLLLSVVRAKIAQKEAEFKNL